MVVKHKYKLLRATAKRWEELNPVLGQGEPGFVYDQNKLKIGNGFTPWNALPYIEGMSEVVNIKEGERFPQKGNPNCIYKKEETKELFQYNINTKKYEKLTAATDINNIIQEEDDILILDCGGTE